MSLLVATVAGLVAVLVACATLPRLRPRASHLALVMLLAMLPALWAGAAAVMASRSRDAANAVRPDEWVRDDDPATLGRLPAVGETAPREQETVTRSDQDETHYHHWSRSEGTFRSGPVTFAFSQYAGDSTSRSSVSSHGWTCESSSNPGSVRQYELRMRRAPDGTAVAFDCHLVNCDGGYLANSTPTCRPGIDPLVFKRVHFARAPVRGSPRRWSCAGSRRAGCDGRGRRPPRSRVLLSPSIRVRSVRCRWRRRRGARSRWHCGPSSGRCARGASQWRGCSRRRSSGRPRRCRP